MNTENAKRMMGAFYEAKRIRDLLPDLPEGILPSYITALDVIRQLEEKNGTVRVSDVADYRHLSRPGVTRILREMEEKGLVTKTPDEKDHRIVLVALTDKGTALYRTYVEDYYRDLSGKLSDIPDKEVSSMVSTIHRIGEALWQPAGTDRAGSR